ncbi:hypothetical protein ACFFX0_25710 [Citricoccus parietis]|uniref:Uncharacterized protein n=1 Tax=Citricoccus parietis TaxID=592307 RepID=A0ABV5G633_9MICC
MPTKGTSCGQGPTLCGRQPRPMKFVRTGSGSVTRFSPRTLKIPRTSASQHSSMERPTTLSVATTLPLRVRSRPPIRASSTGP